MKEFLIGSFLIFGGIILGIVLLCVVVGLIMLIPTPFRVIVIWLLVLGSVTCLLAGHTVAEAFCDWKAGR